MLYIIIMIIGIYTLSLLLIIIPAIIIAVKSYEAVSQQNRSIHFLTKNNKINRHSSQLAIRKTSVHSSTPRDSESDIQNIRQTTFWMKKTIGAPSG